jgi:hypothetical protein
MSIITGALQYSASQRVALTGEEVKDLPVVTYLSGDDIRIESVSLSYRYDFEENRWVANDPVVSTRKYKKDGTPYNAAPSTATVYGPRRGDGPKVWGELIDAHRPTSTLRLEVVS